MTCPHLTTDTLTEGERGAWARQSVAINTKVTAAAKSWMPGSKHPAHLDGT